MKLKTVDLLKALGITLVLLVVLELITTAFLPAIGFSEIRFPFNILIILYICLKVQGPWSAPLIFSLQYTHSLFSIEGWGTGTIAGITISVLISYLKDFVHLSSTVATVLFVQLFQIAWFLITSIILYIQIDTISYLSDKVWRFIPESIFISIISPFIFKLLDAIWNISADSTIGESV